MNGMGNIFEYGIESGGTETGQATEYDAIDEEFAGGIPIESVSNFFRKGRW